MVENNEENATTGANEEIELNEEGKTASNKEPENVAPNQPDDPKGSEPESLSKKTTESVEKGTDNEMKKKEASPPKEAVVDKELLQVSFTNLTT